MIPVTKKLRIVIYFIVLSVIWGGSFILIKKGVEVFSPVQVGSLRMLFAIIVLSPGLFQKSARVEKKRFILIIGIGIMYFLIPSVLYALAQTKIDSSVAGIINSFSVITTLIIGIMFFSHRFITKQFVGILLAIIGLACLVDLNPSKMDWEFNSNVLYILIATLLYGIGNNIIKRYLSDLQSIQINTISLISVLPIVLVLLLSGDFLYRLQNNPGALFSLICIFILGALGTALGRVLSIKLIQLSTPVIASSITFVTPVFAVLFGIWDGEIISKNIIAGMILIISGVVTIHYFGNEKKREIMTSITDV